MTVDGNKVMTGDRYSASPQADADHYFKCQDSLNPSFNPVLAGSTAGEKKGVSTSIRHLAYVHTKNLQLCQRRINI